MSSAALITPLPSQLQGREENTDGSTQTVISFTTVLTTTAVVVDCTTVLLLYTDSTVNRPALWKTILIQERGDKEGAPPTVYRVLFLQTTAAIAPHTIAARCNYAGPSNACIVPEEVDRVRYKSNRVQVLELEII